MNSLLKKFLIGLLVLVLVTVLILAAWVFLISPNLERKKAIEPEEAAKDIEKIVKEYDQVDFNEELGLPYINNEVIVVATEYAGTREIESLAWRFDATVDSTMGDIGIYRFSFPVSKSYSELERIVNDLKRNELVEDAYLSLVSSVEPDLIIDAGAAVVDPVYPEDYWNGDEWDTAVPSGENWGMEAIDAPGAWGYLDQMGTVRVGLIDNMPNTLHEDLSFSNVSCLFVDSKTGSVSTNTYVLSPKDHGSHVSGIMAAKWDFRSDSDLTGEEWEKTGVSGVLGNKGALYYCETYNVTDGKVSSDYHTAYTYLLALKTLIDQDVQVINISQNTCRLIGFAASRGNLNAIRYLTQQANLTEKGLLRIIQAREEAGKKDFVICVAAGNNNALTYYLDDKQPYGYRDYMTLEEVVDGSTGETGESGNALALYNNFLNLMSEEDVKNRILVVGAIGIDANRSTSTSTRYSYSYFSNVGDRVDVVAPGQDIYSCLSYGHDKKDGTSMATPHVAGVAGLVFACNPELTGPEVKQILLASTTGRFTYYQGSSGLINARIAVENALKTKEKPVERVIKKTTDRGLDLCFVVDTTSSMGDDIDNAKENMTEILLHLSEKSSDYRVAIVDYRDFASRTQSAEDYPSKVQLDFSADDNEIKEAILQLDLGYGGDNEETVYSALIAASRLKWRPDAKKVVIILGDAAPLDPEPITGYTYDDALRALLNADLSLDLEQSDHRVVDSFDMSKINVYSIGADPSLDAEDFFQDISNDTGGSYSGIDYASDVSDAIIESIEQIEIVTAVSVDVDFGTSLDDCEIDLYQDDAYLFSFKTDAYGMVRLDDIEPGRYSWRTQGSFSGGTVVIPETQRYLRAESTEQYWFTPLIEKWGTDKPRTVSYAYPVLLVIFLLPLSVAAVITEGKKGRKRQASQFSFCSNCGAKIQPHSAFCGVCGARREDPSAYGIY